MKKSLILVIIPFILLLVYPPVNAQETVLIDAEPNVRTRTGTDADELPPHDKDISEPRPYQPLPKDNCEGSESPCILVEPVNEDAAKQLSREEVRLKFNQALTEQLKNVHTDIEARRSLNETRVNEAHKERVQASLDKAIDRFEEALLRLSGLADKLEERLEAFEERGFDMTSAFAELDHARSTISDSVEAVDGIALTTHTTLTSETPQKARENAKEAIHEARQLLMGAREALVDALRAAKVIIQPAPVLE